jgi:hypothetical protein
VNYVHFKIQTRSLVREGTLNEEESKYQTKENLKCGQGSQREARHQDELTDRLSVANSTSAYDPPLVDEILVPTFVDKGVSLGQRSESPMVVNLSILDRSRYFSFK